MTPTASMRLVARLPALTVVGLLRLWQLVVSPVYGQTCRFYPSCTSYAVEAVDTYGLVRGGWLTLRRLGRCHPWNPGGVDLVPAKWGREPAPGAAGPTSTPHPEASGCPQAGVALDVPNTPATSVADHRPPRRAA